MFHYYLALEFGDYVFQIRNAPEVAVTLLESLVRHTGMCGAADVAVRVGGDRYPQIVVIISHRAALRDELAFIV